MNNSTRETDVEQQIDARSRHFEAAFAAHAARALVEDYFVPDEDSPMASGPGGQPPAVGRAALIALFEGQFAVLRAIRLQRLRLEVSTDLAFELGLAHLTTSAGGNTTGRYTVLWLRRGGHWRAQVDFFAEDGWAYLK